jgi:hypothetical protein
MEYLKWWLIMFIVLSLQSVFSAERVSQRVQYREGKTYSTFYTPQQIEATPIWWTDSPNPPLAAREAIRLASEYARSRFPASTNWRTMQCALVPRENEHWIYEVTLGINFQGLIVTVLMDKTVPEVIVSEGEPSGMPPFPKLPILPDRRPKTNKADR